MASTDAQGTPTPSGLMSVGLDKQAQIDALAAKARISHLAAQLRLRLSYASYKTANKVANVPFATLSKQLEEEENRSGASASSSAITGAFPTVLLPDPVDKTAPIRKQRDPNDPASHPSSNPAMQLYPSLIDFDPDGIRATKRRRVDQEGNAHATGPSTAGLSDLRKELAHNKAKAASPAKSQSLAKAAENASPKKKKKSKKMTGAMHPNPQSILSSDFRAGDWEAVTALVNIKQGGSPKAPQKRSRDGASSSKSASSMVGSDGSLKKPPLKRTASQRSSMDTTSMHGDAAASVASGLDVPPSTIDGHEGGVSGIETVPASPVQGGKDLDAAAIDSLLMLSHSPSPVRNTTQRAPSGGSGLEARVLFPEGSTSKPNTVKQSLTDPSSLLATFTKVPPQGPLLPPPSSPSKKSSSNASKQGDDQPRFLFPGGTPSHYFAAPGYSVQFTGSTQQPSTPIGFNYADYLHLTPTPGPGLSPASRQSGKGNQVPQSIPPAGIQLMQSLMGGAYVGAPYGAPPGFGSPGVGMNMMFLPVPSGPPPVPRKATETKKRKKKADVNGGGDESTKQSESVESKSVEASGSSKPLRTEGSGSVEGGTSAPSRDSTASVGPSMGPPSRPASTAPIPTEILEPSSQG